MFAGLCEGICGHPSAAFDRAVSFEGVHVDNLRCTRLDTTVRSESCSSWQAQLCFWGAACLLE